MTAEDYPVTFPFGATDAPYSPDKPHQGEDRECEMYTPVVVNGTLIGYSGNTGWVTGPHLHIWRSRNNNTSISPAGTGFNLPNASVYATGTDSRNGNWVKIVSDWGYYAYCHLATIHVKPKQLLPQVTGGKGGEITPAIQQEATMKVQQTQAFYDRFNKLKMQLTDEPLTLKEFDAYVGREAFEVTAEYSDSPQAANAYEWQKWGRKAVEDNWGGQLAALIDHVQKADSVNQALQNANNLTLEQRNALQEQLDKGKAVLAECAVIQQERAADAATGQSFLRWLGSLLRLPTIKGQ